MVRGIGAQRSGSLECVVRAAFAGTVGGQQREFCAGNREPNRGGSPGTMTQRVIDARPPMGPRVATPVTASERAAALGHRRLYPIGDRARRSCCRGRKEISVNQKPKSVTHVLNHRCYLCPDCASSCRSLNHHHSTLNEPSGLSTRHFYTCFWRECRWR